MLEENIKALLKVLGYKPKNGTNNVYEKQYSNCNYAITVDFNNKKIDYGTKIKIGNATTINFSKPENFVVLECVNRLLEKGYKPENIELEKIYPSGRGHSGNLDILIYDNNKKAYLMIECKTWGTEFKKEHNKMIKDGGQLFTYYALDRSTKYLCLYTSELNNGKIEYQNNIVPIETDWISLSTSKEIHTHWNKSFKDNGIFESHANPYEIKHKALTYGMLTDLKEEDSGKIFNQIMEILRHNVVSDKPNAFNKLLNLFVCKIIDEDRNESEELHFQWLDDDTDESLQMRLNDLYKKGMYRFLNINVTDYSEIEINNALKGIEADENFKQTIKDMFIDTRLKKSPNFAFKEVLDEKSFKANAKIVKEIVKLLQGYKFRYRQKHQFLGDFFELLLNTSMKQEAGQFFTPVPITRFIISSLPIEEMIINKIKNGEGEILPVVIDYAAGSGHFLTEYMEQVQNILERFGMSLTQTEIDNIIDNLDISFATPTIKNKIRTWIESEKFIWAKDYVYGIDLDDRLVKTAKVSAFFNGDGEANIIWGNGLDNFEISNEYIGKLKETQVFDKKNNGQFDILISNPPYSVEAFKSTLKNGKDTFELYDSLTDNSSEIECLFVERMKQLLKVGGWASVILPVSILTNNGIHSKAREIIFKYFKIKSIVELGSGTFMKTGTNTIILFLERRSDSDYKEIEIAITKFFNDNLDVTVAGIEKAFSRYIANVYDNLTFDDYVNIINGKEINHELYEDYRKEFNGNIEQIRRLEKEKILYFLLTFDQEAVIIKTGQKQKEKRFLGYEFSERRGHEGLKWLSTGTKLYNDQMQLDKTKANSYIYNAFNGIKTEIDDSLIENIHYAYISNLLEYGTSKFDKKVNLNNQIGFKNKYLFQTDNLINIAEIEYGTRIVKNISESQIYPVYGGGGETFKASKYNREDRYIISRFGMSPNCVRFIKGKFFLNDSGMTVKSKNEKIIKDKFLNLLLYNQQQVIYQFGRGPSQKNIDMEAFKKMKIPLPPIDIQQKIIAEFDAIENEYNLLTDQIEQNKNQIESIFETNPIISNSKKEKLRLIAKTNPSKTELNNYNQNILVSFVEMSSVSNEGYIINKIDKKLSEVRNGSYTYFAENDIILAKITPCMENGKCAIANKLTNGLGMGSSEFHVLRCSDSINNKYLFTYINRDIIRKEAEQNMTGASGHRRVPITFYENLNIPLPSLDDQKKIVSEIEKLEHNILKAQNKLQKLKIDKLSILDKHLC